MTHQLVHVVYPGYDLASCNAVRHFRFVWRVCTLVLLNLYCMCRSEFCKAYNLSSNIAARTRSIVL